MYKLATAAIALVSTATGKTVGNSSSSIPQWVDCDIQMSCDQVLSQASNTTVTGSTCYGVGYYP
jgi:hypothetical protein